jgi:DNA-binding MarR family transcriptional regulator
VAPFLEEPGALSFLVRRAWLSMRAALDSELKAYGLSTAQYATLMILEDDPGRTPAEVGRKVASSRQAATELLAGLERDGLITRRPHPSDRRTQQVHLTDAGRRRLDRAKVAVARLEAALEEPFSAAQRKEARTWLDAVSVACDQMPPPDQVS